MEKEKDEVDDAEHEACLWEALTDTTKVVKLVSGKWFVDKGFGFGKALNKGNRLHPCQRRARPPRSTHDRH